MTESSPDRGRRRRLTIAAVATFLAASVALATLNGILITRDAVFLWVMVGLLALSISDVNRWLKGFVFDWLPFAGALFVYDLLRGLVGQDPLYTPHLFPQIDADVAIFGSVPSVSLQQSFFDPATLDWLDYATWGIYLTHFFAVFVVAALLWRFAYPRFRRFRTLVLTVTAMAFVTYALFPAVPPWMASEMGTIGPVTRVVGEVWTGLGILPAAAIWEEGSAFANLVAAIPSLHAAYPVLIMLFFWSSGWWARALGVAYSLAMSFTLAYTGEHYVFDLFLGWLYAGASFGVVAAGAATWRRLKERWPERLPGGARPAPATEPQLAAATSGEPG